MVRSVLCLVALGIAGSVAVATTLPPIPVSDLFKDADVVVVAEVVKGELIGSGEETCGAKYFAHVEESFKGSQKGSTIEFGNFHGYQLGGRYVLFLTRPGRTHEPMTSTNSMHLQAMALLQQRCGPKLVRNTVMHSGFGALQVHWTGKFNYKEGVRVPTQYVVMPKDVQTAAATPSEAEEFSGVVWVKLEDMLQLLRGFAK